MRHGRAGLWRAGDILRDVRAGGGIVHRPGVHRSAGCVLQDSTALDGHQLVRGGTEHRPGGGGAA